MKYKFEIFEIKNGKQLSVAKGEGNNLDKVSKECMHYAIQYSQDGKIKVKANWFKDNLKGLIE